MPDPVHLVAFYLHIGTLSPCYSGLRTQAYLHRICTHPRTLCNPFQSRSTNSYLQAAHGLQQSVQTSKRTMDSLYFSAPKIGIESLTLTTSRSISLGYGISSASPSPPIANFPCSKRLRMKTTPSLLSGSTAWARAAAASPLPPITSCFPPYCVMTTDLLSPGSNRTAVPAGISRRRCFWKARIRSNRSEPLVSRNG